MDPDLSKKEAVINPQLWNLYTLCRDNPLLYVDADGNKDKPFDSKIDKPVSDKPGTATHLDEKNPKNSKNRKAYNCIAHAFNKDKGAPADFANASMVAIGAINWDNNPDISIKKYQQLAADIPNVIGDIVVYYIDKDSIGKYDIGKDTFVHVGIVVGVDNEGNTTIVDSKRGSEGLSENHPLAPGFYKGTSRVYMRKK